MKGVSQTNRRNLAPHRHPGWLHIDSCRRDRPRRVSVVRVPGGIPGPEGFVPYGDPSGPYGDPSGHSVEMGPGGFVPYGDPSGNPGAFVPYGDPYGNTFGDPGANTPHRGTADRVATEADNEAKLRTHMGAIRGQPVASLVPCLSAEGREKTFPGGAQFPRRGHLQPGCLACRFPDQRHWARTAIRVRAPYRKSLPKACTASGQFGPMTAL